MSFEEILSGQDILQLELLKSKKWPRNLLETSLATSSRFGAESSKLDFIDLSAGLHLQLCRISITYAVLTTYFPQDRPLPHPGILPPLDAPAETKRCRSEDE